MPSAAGRMRPFAVVAALCVLPAAALVASANPPATRVEAVTDVIHGREIVDRYRWLEGDNSNPARMGVTTPEVMDWTRAQNGYTRQMLDNLPGRQALEARLRELMEVPSISAPTMRGDRYFYTRREGDQPQPVVWMREGLDAEPRALLDPSAVDASGLTALGWYEPNNDGTLMAFGLYRAGDENSTLYVMDVDSGEWLAEEIPGKVGGAQWLPDSSGFFYERLEDVNNPYSAQFKFHRLGTHHRQDPVLFEQDKEGPLATTWGPFGVVDRQARWLVKGYWVSTAATDFWVADLDEWFRTGELNWKVMVQGEQGRSGSFQFLGDTLYMQTQIGAPNGRVVAIDLHNPGLAYWRDVVPAQPGRTLEGVSMARGMLAVNFLENAYTGIELFNLDGTTRGRMELPGIGSAGLSTSDDRTEAFLTYTSYNEPSSIYRVDLATGDRSLWERPDVPVDPSLVEVRQVRYESADGTPVTMFLVHRRGLVLNGNNPTLLYGYGGFDISMTPSFSATMFPWFEAGGVYAVANLRGGGEYGASWHEAGMLENKQNVFNDFIAAAEWLIANNYTNPRRLAIAGGSNGGLLTGATVTQRPDLFAAAIVGVPLLDMVRFQHFLMARYWVPEYGDAERSEHELEYMMAYSPYHNIHEGTRYPAVLLTAGENDTRVHALHARKMAAALQAATASDPDQDPVLLWVDLEGGHGQGKPLDLRVRDVADQRIFLMWQLGMLD
ncbi:MAG: S9 family peptidase [Phycisphaeraceae bacterium]|nr:S9 family peptidase [Phycisphaeraceae bacterium]